MNNMPENRRIYMKSALALAEKSGEDIPVGAVLLMGGQIIAQAHNRKEIDNDPTAHAEIVVIREAVKKIQSHRLDGAVLYVTLEPCPMCAGAILYSRISEVVFGAYDTLYGAFGSALNMSEYIKFYPKITGGIMEDECSALLKQFFGKKRTEKTNLCRH